MPKPRKKSERKVKTKIYIFCEGRKTEPNYIRAYIRHFHPACVRLKDAERPVEIKDTVKNTPKELVEAAVKFSKTAEHEEDSIWVMYDRESAAKYSDDNHQTAWHKAKNNNIKMANQQASRC
jgi:hypothetical protein